MYRQFFPKIWRVSREISIARSMDKLWGQDYISTLPTFIGIALEERCFFRCKHCNIWQTPKYVHALTTDDYKHILRLLKTWTGGRVSVSFSGGEPFLNPDAIEIIQFAHTLGFTTNTTTNGFLINEEMAKRIVHSGLDHIAVSLDFPDAQRHNEFRGYPLAYQRATNAITLLNKYAKGGTTKVKINTVLMKKNLRDISRMVELAKSLGVNSISFQPIYETFSTPRHNPLWYKTNELWPTDAQEVNKAIDVLLRLKFQQGLFIDISERQLEMYRSYFTDYSACIKINRCYVGVSNFLIDRFGDVRLCYFFAPIGNILKEHPAKLWNNERAATARRTCRGCQRGCRILLCNTTPTTREIISRIIAKLLSSKAVSPQPHV